MSNERKTENYVRGMLSKHGYFNSADTIQVEEQQSDNPKIKKLLKTASKAGGGAGFPEFIITSSDHPELLIVIECKAETKFHRSPTLDNWSAYACDGALLYASYLSKNYDVIAIGVSGENAAEIRISSFLHLKGKHKATEMPISEILNISDYNTAYTQSPEKFNQDYAALLAYSQDLNRTLHKLKVKESQRSLLISGILIALKSTAFKSGYKHHHTAQQLTKSLLQTVLDELTNAGIASSRLENLKNAYSFITTHSVLSIKKKELVELIEEVDREINGFMETHEYFDTIGQFYIEFLRYANNDKGLGIVLTPPHITELFVQLAGVTSSSIVWDNCCGTGGFLISAMKKMVADCGGDTARTNAVKSQQLFGLEHQDDIFALAVSNMILHGDGKSNIQLGDTFDKLNDPKVQPTVGLLNPPYKADANDIDELEFVLRNASALAPNGKCISIIPISCLSGTDAKSVELKRRIMERHTVEAVMSMPEDLFHNSKVGVITAVLVLSAHTPHPENKKVWLGYWRNDGFVKVKGRGRIDANDEWKDIKLQWLEAYQNRDEDGVRSVKCALAPEDEWCAEAYLTVDYSLLDESMFKKALRKYVAFSISEASAEND